MQIERSSVGAASRWGAHPPGLEPEALHGFFKPPMRPGAVASSSSQKKKKEGWRTTRVEGLQIVAAKPRKGHG